MKTTKIVYWVTTALLGLFILPGIFFINTPFAQEGTRALSIPGWLALEVGIGTFIGGLILVLPVGKRLKEWGYVGLGIVYISALIGHLSVDGFVPMSFSPLVLFAILLASYISYHKTH